MIKFKGKIKIKNKKKLTEITINENCHSKVTHALSMTKSLINQNDILPY